MVRRFVPRISLFRPFSRVSSPILPLASRLGVSASSPLSNNVRRTTPLSRFFGHTPSRLASPPPSPNTDERPTLPPDATLSQRLKHLIKSYGWYALGVYAILSATDFAVAFAGINLLGAEQVSRITTAVKTAVYNSVHSKPREPGREEMDMVSAGSQAGGGSGQEGMYAMLVLAYTVHKTLFMPVRVGLTAALTPRIVGWLRARGWAGGQGAKRAATEMRERMRRGKNRD